MLQYSMPRITSSTTIIVYAIKTHLKCIYVMSILSNSRFYKINIQNVDFVKSTFDKIDITYTYVYIYVYIYRID